MSGTKPLPSGELGGEGEGKEYIPRQLCLSGNWVLATSCTIMEAAENSCLSTDLSGSAGPGLSRGMPPTGKVFQVGAMGVGAAVEARASRRVQARRGSTRQDLALSQHCGRGEADAADSPVWGLRSWVVRRARPEVGARYPGGQSLLPEALEQGWGQRAGLDSSEGA